MVQRLRSTFLYLLAAFLAPNLQAMITEDQPSQSFFNSHLLNDGEAQISILGTLEAGVSENLQLGTQGLIWLFRLPNIFLKHRMFKTNTTQTSFTSFSLLQPKTKLAHTEQTVEGVLSIHGVVTGYEVNERLTFNFGPMRFYSNSKHESEVSNGITRKNQIEIEAYAALLGLDFRRSEEWSFSAFVLLPLYFDAIFIGDSTDGGFTLLPSSKLYNDGYFLASTYATRSWESFNLDIGFILAKQVYPYFSAYWRF